MVLQDTDEAWFDMWLKERMKLGRDICLDAICFGELILCATEVEIRHAWLKLY